MGAAPLRREIAFGPERLPPSACPPRHQHRSAYATVVLDGAYDQFAYAGRLRVAPGDVLVQPTFDCHFDRMATRGVTLLRLPWGRDGSFGGVHRGLDVDEIVRAARRDVFEAAAILAQRLAGRAPVQPRIDDWGDRLAQDLRGDPRLRIARWAEHSGVAREHLSRTFAAAYGVTPARFRLEVQAREAWLRATGSEAPLAAIAHDLGFSDQAHMSRAVAWLTGAAPGAWRRHIGSRPSARPAPSLAG